MAKQFVQITQDYWDAHPEIQADYKVGDVLEVETTDNDLPQPQASNTPSGSDVLDNIHKTFNFDPGKITATNKTISLPSGATATITEFKGKHVTKAQRFMAANKDNGMDGMDMMPIIISLCTLIDGKPITPEDYNEMPGMDALELMGEFSAANFRKS